MKTPVFGLAGEAAKTPLHYTGCGLDGIYLVNGYEVHKTPYGEGVSINNLDGLLEAIGSYLVSHKQTLSGKDIRFLRCRMEITQSELGRLLGMSTQQVARYEKDHSVIPGPAARLLRVLYSEAQGNRICVHELLEYLDEVDEPRVERALFEPDESGAGWRMAA